MVRVERRESFETSCTEILYDSSSYEIIKTVFVLIRDLFLYLKNAKVSQLRHSHNTYLSVRFEQR